ncbi:hypothetical protein [Natronorubrum texcoconense]|uniref:Uncharacterized protein n=1 Tax=Natronorubrum texcoconense TaxID=1095776 RepID=A0A1G9H681_9EURY|nr:hypothetical protein [Natronorubrum texcoconense]SDL08392.1 hypothetical protein SAMN04515672_0117 [Natronorubrum texcoconense]
MNNEDQRLTPKLGKHLVIILIFGFSIPAILATLTGAFEEAYQISTVVSSIATVVLVYVTFRYVRHTDQLVEETQQARLEEQQRQQEQRKRELTALRRGLLHEIQAGDDLEFFDENGVGNGNAVRRPAPTTIYEQNTDRIGLLTRQEIDAIVNYYTLLQKFEDELYLRNETNRGKVFRLVTTPAKIQSAEDEAIEAIKTNIDGTD